MQQPPPSWFDWWFDCWFDCPCCCSSPCSLGLACWQAVQQACWVWIRPGQQLLPPHAGASHFPRCWNTQHCSQALAGVRCCVTAAGRRVLGSVVQQLRDWYHAAKLRRLGMIMQQGSGFGECYAAAERLGEGCFTAGLRVWDVLCGRAQGLGSVV